MQRQPEDTQTIYAELFGVLVARDAARSWAQLPGSFSRKTVAGLDYLYFQYSEPGGARRQLALGRATPALERRIAAVSLDRSADSEELATIQRLSQMLFAASGHVLPHAPARVLAALADAGLFRLGGVLVGSYGFSLLGNVLGFCWPEAAWRTQDIDVASPVEIAAPLLTTDVPSTLEGLQMGFVPVPQLNPRHASTSFKVRGQQLRVDLLTPGRDGQEDPVFIPRFQAAAAPIKYLSLLLAEPVATAAPHRKGAALVTVPDPARFALHKLLVSQTRSATQQSKSGKDMHQASLLLACLVEDRPDDLEAACAAFRASGPAVTTKVLRGLLAMAKRWPVGAAKDAVRRHLRA